ARTPPPPAPPAMITPVAARVRQAVDAEALMVPAAGDGRTRTYHADAPSDAPPDASTDAPAAPGQTHPDRAPAHAPGTRQPDASETHPNSVPGRTRKRRSDAPRKRTRTRTGRTTQTRSDEQLLAILADPESVPRDDDGTVPVRRAQRAFDPYL